MRRVVPFVLVTLLVALTAGLFLLAPRTARVRSKLEEAWKDHTAGDPIHVSAEEELP